MKTVLHVENKWKDELGYSARQSNITADKRDGNQKNTHIFCFKMLILNILRVYRKRRRSNWVLMDFVLIFKCGGVFFFFSFSFPVIFEQSGWCVFLFRKFMFVFMCVCMRLCVFGLWRLHTLTCDFVQFDYNPNNKL